MPRRKSKKDKKQKLYVIAAILFIVMMLVPIWLKGYTGGGGTATITQEELKKYLFIPPPGNFTVMLFIASAKECPTCPMVASNVTQAINILKNMFKTHHMNVTVEYKVFLCEGFPACKDKEALVNFKVYRVSSVPLLLLSYRGLLVPVDPTGLGPQRLAFLLFQWYNVMKEAWMPPKTGKYMLYLYDEEHKSPYLDTLLQQAKMNNVTVVQLGCKLYPSNCTNITALSTMLVLGLRPTDLPLVIVYKDGRAIAGAKVDNLQGVDKILQALKN